MSVASTAVGAGVEEAHVGLPVGEAVVEIGDAGDDPLGVAGVGERDRRDEQRVAGGVVEHRGVGGDFAAAGR